MTEQRFEYTAYEDGTASIYDKLTDEYYFDMELSKLEEEVLSKLHDENEQLKSRVEYLERKIDRERTSHQKQHEKWEEEIQKENEQLKKKDELFFGKVFDILLKYQDLFNREMADEILEELGIELTRWFE